jgi:hypothetical protein
MANIVESYNYIKELQQNGVIHIKNAYTMEQMTIMKDIYIKTWNEIKCDFPTDWITRTYKQNCKKYDDFMGMDLYNNKKFAYYKNTEILDMDKNRYDFVYNLDSIKLQIELPKIIVDIMDSILGCEYDYYYGGLPIEQVNQYEYSVDSISADSNNKEFNGFWHRDAYSLYNNEAIDLGLPPFYYTMLIPLQYTDKNNGGTEFILGSHNILLSEMKIDNYKKLNTWIDNIDNKQRFTPTLDIGDICIFHGYTIHRGLFNNISKNRDMLYIVCKKNWYNDEPISNYNENYSSINT